VFSFQHIAREACPDRQASWCSPSERKPVPLRGVREYSLTPMQTACTGHQGQSLSSSCTRTPGDHESAGAGYYASLWRYRPSGASPCPSCFGGQVAVTNGSGEGADTVCEQILPAKLWLLRTCLTADKRTIVTWDTMSVTRGLPRSTGWLDGHRLSRPKRNCSLRSFCSQNSWNMPASGRRSISAETSAEAFAFRSASSRMVTADGSLRVVSAAARLASVPAALMAPASRRTRSSSAVAAGSLRLAWAAARLASGLAWLVAPACPSASSRWAKVYGLSGPVSTAE
jgi:hypothetical protein